MRWQDVTEFWFGDLQDGFADDTHRERWFNGSDSFDAACAELARPVLESAAPEDLLNGPLATWLQQPEGRLAFILLCDQFPRNIYRGTAQAFAWDTTALTVARQGILAGADRTLGWDQRSFFYLPFEHSEDLLDQHTAVGLFAQLRDETPAGKREVTGNYLRYAHVHRDIIQRFGRFPHRNKVLGRSSTDAETDFLSSGNAFGQ